MEQGRGGGYSFGVRGEPKNPIVGDSHGSNGLQPEPTFLKKRSMVYGRWGRVSFLLQLTNQKR